MMGPTVKRMQINNPCVTCCKRCLTIPKNGCAWWEPKDKSRGWQDVFEQIDYSWYEGDPGENVYVWG